MNTGDLKAMNQILKANIDNESIATTKLPHTT